MCHLHKKNELLANAFNEVLENELSLIESDGFFHSIWTSSAWNNHKNMLVAMDIQPPFLIISPQRGHELINIDTIYHPHLYKKINL